ncbi:MAG: tyrosine-type recombinase/integrase [Bacteroidetes bacterium]|jgi:integrase|nr:tyrosine-type recombinase/integrase [Bacteroidota bacterium]
MRGQLPYKLPTICRCKSGEWYIQYFYEYPDQPGKFKAFKVKDGINRIHDLQQKETAAKQLRDDIIYWLEVLNYNPFEQKKDIISQISNELERQSTPVNWSLTNAISEFRKFIKKQNYAVRTAQTYDNYLYNLERYLNEFSEKNVEACQFTEFDLMIFLDIESDELMWSARTYNNYLEFYRTFFNRCEKLEKQTNRKISYDFDLQGIDLKITTPQKNKAYSPVIVNSIKAELSRQGNENLRDYIEWIYLSLMRPAEIRALKVKNIDEVNRQIRIVGKTGDRLIPISEQLLRLIKKRDLMNYPFNNYVFGMAGDVSAISMNKDYFPRKYIEIKNSLGLEKNYTLYAWKHTAVINMIYAGFTDEEIMVLSGHKTKDAFNAYKRDLVIEKGHAMKGELIDF